MTGAEITQTRTFFSNFALDFKLTLSRTLHSSFSLTLGHPCQLKFWLTNPFLNFQHLDIPSKCRNYLSVYFTAFYLLQLFRSFCFKILWVHLREIWNFPANFVCETTRFLATFLFLFVDFVLESASYLFCVTFQLEFPYLILQTFYIVGRN